jgi:hypothetical protein
MVNLPRCTTTISGQPFEQSRNDFPGAGVRAHAGGKVVIQPHRMNETARKTSIHLVLELPPTRSLPVNALASFVAQNSVRRIFSPSLLAVLLLTEQYAAKNQCSQEK